MTAGHIHLAKALDPTFVDQTRQVDEMVEAHKDYILGETLSDELTKAAPPDGAYTKEHEMDGLDVTFAVKRV